MPVVVLSLYRFLATSAAGIAEEESCGLATITESCESADNDRSTALFFNAALVLP